MDHPQRQRFPVLRFQGLEGVGHPLPVLLGGKALFGTGSRVRYIQGPPVAVAVLHMEGKDLSLLLPPQMVNTEVAAQTIQPGGKGRVGPEGAETAPRFEKGLLCQVHGVVGVAAHAQTKVIDGFFVGQNQLFKGVAVTGGGFADQLCIHGVHLKSRWMPLAMA